MLCVQSAFLAASMGDDPAGGPGKVPASIAGVEPGTSKTHTPAHSHRAFAKSVAQPPPWLEGRAGIGDGRLNLSAICNAEVLNESFICKNTDSPFFPLFCSWALCLRR
jgi:hypothetical protein